MWKSNHRAVGVVEGQDVIQVGEHGNSEGLLVATDHAAIIKSVEVDILIFELALQLIIIFLAIFGGGRVVQSPLRDRFMYFLKAHSLFLNDSRKVFEPIYWLKHDFFLFISLEFLMIGNVDEGSDIRR